jgi:hypothetical protein
MISISMALGLVHMIDSNIHAAARRPLAALLSVEAGAAATQNFRKTRNHPDNQYEEIDRQAAVIDIGALIAKGPESSG